MIHSLEQFMPHGMCYLWKPDLLLMHVGADAMISLSYLSLPALLIYITRKRPDLPLKNVIYFYILFIFLCGLTHIMEIINVWNSAYYVSGAIKVVTGLVSIGAVAVMFKGLRPILKLPNFSLVVDKLEDDQFELLDKISAGLIYSDSEGIIKYVNNMLLEIFGYNNVSELIGQKVEALIAPSLRANHINLREHFFANVTDLNMSGNRFLHGVKKDGTEVLLDIHLSPLKVRNKIGALLSIVDVTNLEYLTRKTAQQSEILDVVTSNIPALLSYVDESGRYRFVNDAYEKFWKKDRSEIVNKKVEEFLPVSTYNDSKPYLDKAFKGVEAKFRLSIKRKGENFVYLDVNYLPHIKDNEVKGFVVLCHDITSIEKTKRDLEQKNKSLEEYAFLASHDLRAPLRHISNFSDMLEEELKKLFDIENNKKVRQYLNVLKSNAIKMQNMVSALLKIAAIDKVKLHLSTVKLSELVSSAIDSSGISEKLNINYNNAMDLELYVDAELYTQVFQNLLENAIKYNENESTIINFNFSETDNFKIIHYSDNSAGVDPDLYEDIFKSFWKMDNNREGLGVGLSTTKKIVELHHGKIYCVKVDSGFAINIEVAK